jgi:hypothetical protein
VTFLIILFLLQIKHVLADFVWQTDAQLKYKGVYGHPLGVEHSVIHSALTAVIFLIFFGIQPAIFAGLIDFFLHYHIDYVKMRYGEKDIAQKRFWIHFGLDQFAHQATYIILIVLISGNLWHNI